MRNTTTIFSGRQRVPSGTLAPFEDELTEPMSLLEAAFVELEEPVHFSPSLKPRAYGTAPEGKEYARPIITKWQKGLRVFRYVSVLAVFGFSTFTAYDILIGGQRFASSGQAASAQMGEPAPQSQPVEEVAISNEQIQQYKTEKNTPKRIYFSGVQVNSRVVSQGLSNNDTLLTAKNIHDLSWYKGSALPGTSGVSVLSGSLAGPSKHSNLAPLSGMSVGQKVIVTKGDDTAAFYRVTSVTTLTKLDNISDLLANGVGAQTLKIILNDKSSHTGDDARSYLLITAETYQEVQPKPAKYYRRW